MSFLVILCEGASEMDFAGGVLAPHLRPHGVGIHQIAIGKKVKHDIPEAPGGVLRFEPVYRHIAAELRRHSSDTSFVSTMLDVYALPQDFPEYDIHSRIPNPAERVIALEAAWGRRVDDPRFIPHIQLHEFEALVLAKPDEILAEFEEPLASEGLSALLQEVQGLNPEEVNQTREGAPSKRLLRCFPGYAKRRMGASITKRIGCAWLREACPHFGSWLSKLEGLANP